MAYKWVDESKLNAALTASADAIREKTGDTAQIDFDMENETGFESAIEEIEGGGGGIDMSVTSDQIKMLVYVSENTNQPYVNYIQTIANDVSVNWGDGSPEEMHPSTGSDRYNCATLSHIYSNYGWTVITFTRHFGQINFISNNGFLGYAGASGFTNGNQYPNNGLYRNAVAQINYGSQSFVSGMAGCAGIQYINPQVRNDTSISYADNYCLREAIIPEGSVFCPMYTSCSSINKVTIPSTITSIPMNGFRSCRSLVLVDFTAVQLVDGHLPITFGTGVFESRNNDLRLLFANQEIAEEAKITTNLSSYASIIHYVGEEDT